MSCCSINVRKIVENNNSDLESSEGEERVEQICVTQTREMRRKGVKLPRGWKIFGTKKETNIDSHGDSYSYISIDWKYTSPDGRVFTDLKKVLSAIKQNTPKFERWEVAAPKKSGSERYVTLKEQFDDELDRILDEDVFAVSGVRPVRKFPDNSLFRTWSRDSKGNNEHSEDHVPSRMSAKLKSNPISLAQKEKMMRKSGPSIQRFNISKVFPITGDNSDGWFSSKILALKVLSEGKVKCHKVDLVSPVLCFGSSDKKVQLKVVNDQDVPFIKDIDQEVASHEHPSSRSPTPTKSRSRNVSLPNLRKKLIRKVNLPQNWVIKKSDQNLTQIISPEGKVFDSLESASKFLSYLNTTKPAFSKSSFSPNKRKLFHLDLPQSTVIRKQTPFPCIKKFRLSEREIEDMLESDDFADSLEELLSDSEEN